MTLCEIPQAMTSSFALKYDVHNVHCDLFRQSLSQRLIFVLYPSRLRQIKCKPVWEKNRSRVIECMHLAMLAAGRDYMRVCFLTANIVYIFALNKFICEQNFPIKKMLSNPFVSYQMHVFVIKSILLFSVKHYCQIWFK